LLPRIHGKTLVVSSRADAVVPPAASEEMAALLPDPSLEWLEPTGHMTPLEQPTALANLLRTLL
jgi:pimeloyl-ACP methyl ester carboxylesterase